MLVVHEIVAAEENWSIKSISTILSKVFELKRDQMYIEEIGRVRAYIIK